MKNQSKINKLTTSAMLLALALLLPFVAGSVPTVGNMLCPMHFPVFLAGFFVGPWWGMLVGFIAPLLRSLIFGMPPILPKGIGMAFELATYGLVCGLLYAKLPRKKSSIYVSLVSAMIAGRIVWGIVRSALYKVGSYEFSFKLFISGAFTTAIPGIILQLVLIPIIVMALEKQRNN